MANVNIINEVQHGKKGDWILCFQYCEYKYDDDSSENGYRFIWRRQDGSLQAARGQARIPSVAIVIDLISKAIQEGWGNHLN